MAADKQHAHQLIEQLDASQVPAAISMLESLLDPVARAIANAPVDDEPESAEESQAVAKSKAWFKEHGGKGIPHEEILADFGLTPDDLDSAFALIEGHPGFLPPGFRMKGGPPAR